MRHPAGGYLGFELAPVEDELLGGWLVRHRSLLRLATNHAFLMSVVGRRDLGKSPILPIGLARLPGNLPSGSHTHESLLRDHTGHPYFASFDSKDRAGSLAEAMRHGWTGFDQRSTAYSVIAEHELMIYCRTCRSDQIARSGEAIWNRVHQMPGVFMCHLHDEVLTASMIRARSGMVASPPDDTHSTRLEPPFSLPIARRVARLTAHFLHEPRSIRSMDQLRAGVRVLLADAGWLREHGRLRPDLWRSFAMHLGESALRRLRVSASSRATWIHDMAGKNSVHHHPLRYILLFDFLGMDPVDLGSFPPPRWDVSTAPSRSAGRPPVLDPKSLAADREVVLAALANGLTRAQVQKKHARRFRDLRAFDRDWFDVHLPMVRSPALHAARRNAAKDAGYADLASRVIERLRQARDAPRRRITMNLIGEEIGLAKLARLKARFPNTVAVAEAACEGIVQHRINMLRWAAERFRDEGASPSYTDFVVRANFPTEKYPELWGLAREIYGSLVSAHRQAT